jgi:hypothetical protein
MTGQVPGNRTLAGACGPVNGDYDFLSRNCRRTGVHPRLLVLGFGRAVKPYRLLFPALAPAVKAGVRLPRGARVSLCESLSAEALRPEAVRPEALRPEALRPEALRDNVPVRPAEPGLPLAAVPFPLRFAQLPTDGFPLRVPLAEWPLELDEWPLEVAERPAAGRASALRRGVRALDADCAGLRFRACCAGRLKCARAGAGLLFSGAL